MRSIVRIGYDNRVHKTFRGTGADERFANEVAVLTALEERGCEFVPKLLDSDPETFTIVTTNCGQPFESISEEKAKTLFDELEHDYGIIHDDPFPRNITYHAITGRFFVIDFELAQILPAPKPIAYSDNDHLQLNWFGKSVDGTRKPGNDDCLAAFASNQGWAVELELSGQIDISDIGAVFAVSDGMGGTSGGGYASWLAVKELRQFLPASMGSFEGSADPLMHLAKAVVGLNDHVNRLSAYKAECHDMGATLICGLFSERSMHFAHVGDSRIYQYFDGELTQLTNDHSPVGKLEASGQLNEREARSHPQRNLLYQAIGRSADKFQPQVGSAPLQSGMWFLFCSDGLIDGVWNNRIKNEIEFSIKKDRSPEDTAQALLKEARFAAGKDDTTLFVIQVV